MKPRAIVMGAAVLLAGAVLSASGPLGVYAVIDKVVLEPNDQLPQRIQIWGAFAYVDGASSGTTISTARRGYLYFMVPEYWPEPSVTTIRREWADLKSVAGTGQAVGFGRWTYIAAFSALRPDALPVAPSIIVAPWGGAAVDLRVRSESETPANPTQYLTNTGVVRISDTSHAAVVKALREAPKR